VTEPSARAVEPGYPVSTQEKVRAWLITLNLCPQRGCVFELNHRDLCTLQYWKREERRHERYPD
jgi:hypothetical protein